MFTKIAKAGVIDDAPTLYELILSFTNKVLTFVAVLAVLMVIISGVIYMTSFGKSEQTITAKRYLISSVAGLVVVLLSLVIVNAIVGLF